MASPINPASYVPLGAVVLPASENPSPFQSIPAENEFDATSTISTWLPADHPLCSPLSTLISLRVVRVTVAFERILRVYFLPDDVGRTQVPVRSHAYAKKTLNQLLLELDNTHATWSGSRDSIARHYKPPRAGLDSLFFLFNTLPSPHPNSDKVPDTFAADAMLELLEDPTLSGGLKTPLYTYQQRSAAMMIQKEACPQLKLDPRLSILTGPTGKQFYCDWHINEVLSEPRLYSDARGGMLAETMGHGKSLITLALIMATQGHIPRRPEQQAYEEDPVEEATTKSFGCRKLSEMAAAAIARHNIPWKRHFSELARRGDHYDTCTNLLQQRFSHYRTPSDPPEGTSSRAARVLSRKIHIAPVTLMVVPLTLISQWESQIHEHVEPGCLTWLTIDKTPRKFPPAEELVKYDMILMAKNVFESEIIRSEPAYPPVAPADCSVCKTASERADPTTSNSAKPSSSGHCIEHKHWSPLLDIHFLRFVVDEGHDFISAASTQTNATRALKAIRVERKWLVSGTPSQGLIGAELERAVENGIDPLSSSSSPVRDIQLAQRRSDSDLQEREDIRRLGKIVSEFLGLQPWANSGIDKADWAKYVIPSGKTQRKSASVGSILESLVVRHRIEDIDRDIKLPPLTNSVVHLDPSFYDKLSLNLFIMVLTANAITSERADEDYMFHPKNKSSLDALIRNLRHSGFFWSGFSRTDIRQTIKTAQDYLDNPTKSPSALDRETLQKTIEIGHAALGNHGWLAFHRSEQIGFYVDTFPYEAEDNWTLSPKMLQEGNPPRGFQPPMLIGGSNLPHAQKYVDDRLYAANPMDGLAAYADEVWERLRISEEREKSRSESDSPPKKRGTKKSTKVHAKNQPILPPTTIPPSTTKAVPQHSAAKFAENKARTKKPVKAPKQAVGRASGLKSSLKTATPRAPEVPSAWEELSQSELTGTSSAKLSYLMDRCWELHKDEKILIFYEGDDIAYYIAQGLEMLGIPHFIYAAKLDQKLRTSYLHEFNHEDRERVMLMDLKLAAHGLHIAVASRVFFVNPVWNPSIEAQAIKRAHRIGQSKPVIAETLVLRGTLEDQLITRSKEMSSTEHKLARSPLDDNLMADLIRAATFLPIDDNDFKSQFRQFALLKTKQRVFGREVAENLEEAQAQGIPTVAAKPRTYKPTSPSKKRKTVAMFDESPTKKRKSSSSSGAATSPESVRLLYSRGSDGSNVESYTPQDSPTPTMWSNMRVVIPWVDSSTWQLSHDEEDMDDEELDYEEGEEQQTLGFFLPHTNNTRDRILPLQTTDDLMEFDQDVIAGARSRVAEELLDGDAIAYRQLGSFIPPPIRFGRRSRH